MSNANVGQVYQQIIRDVVESSRVDFEEGGVDEGVLEELSRGWQMKLSQSGIAQFPWDPKPEPLPTPTPLASTPVPMSNINYQQSAATPPMNQPQSALSLPQLPPMQQQQQQHMMPNNGPRIKAEPGLEMGMNQAPPAYNIPNTMPSTTSAAQRAAQNLQATYGASAAASIRAIQGGMPQPQGQQQHMQQQNMQQNMQQQQQNPGQPQVTRPQMSHAQYQQAMAQQAAQQRQKLESQRGASGGQTDGGGDDEDESETHGIMKRYDSHGNEIEMGRVEIDQMIRRKIEAMGQSMEGGGLMLSLHKLKKTGKNRKRKVASGLAGSNAIVVSSSSTLAQYDGVDDDDDDDGSNALKDDPDEDAINSDLDDPDDGLNEDDDDDEGMGHIMLCMYDKVQRVKNKWKCVMKDGVLTVDGKEYVFHKANGEYEW